MNFLKQSFNEITNPLKKFLGYKRCLIKKNLKYHLDSDEQINKNSEYFTNKLIEESKLFDVNQNINSIISWVPFIKNKTSIIIYNFFSRNYSLRKNLLIKIMVTKNHEIIFLKFKSLKQDEILELDRNFFSEISEERGLLILELIHPNISKNHGGGQFRFWGKYFDDEDQYSATVHSMPLKKLIYEKEKIYTRNYFPSPKNELENLNFSLDSSVIKNEKKLFSLGGYNVVMDKKNNPLSIWHLGPAFNQKNLNLENKRNSQCFWVPKNKMLNPRIIIDEKETYVKDNESQNLLIKIIKNQKIIFKKELIFKGYFEKTLSQIFNQNFNFEYIVYLEFNSRQFSYIQINYDNENIGDQMHTHKANMKYDEQNQNIVINYGNVKNCRKFMHISINQNKYKNYLIIHNSLLKEKLKKKIKIRFLHENYFEEVKNIEIDEIDLLKVFNIEELFKENIKYFQNTNAIIQIESNDLNFDATMICQNIINDKIAVDHLTGG